MTSFSGQGSDPFGEGPSQLCWEVWVCATKCKCHGPPESQGWGTGGNVHPAEQPPCSGSLSAVAPAASSLAKPPVTDVLGAPGWGDLVLLGSFPSDF